MSTATSSSSPMIGVSRRIWNKCSKEPILAHLTSFVAYLASGELNIDGSFRDFLAQALGFQVAEDDDAKSAIEKLRNAVLQECDRTISDDDDSFVQEWGSDPINKSPLNHLYKKWIDKYSSGIIDRTEDAAIVLATSFEKTKIALYTLGVIMPCMRLYAFMGKELKAHIGTDDSNHLYKKWIDKYSSESFEVSAQETEDLLDTLSVSLTRDELDIVEKLYLQALRVEIEFLTAQPLVKDTLAGSFSNFAAQTHVANSFGNSFAFTKNIYGAHVLLEAAKVTGQIKRFILVSTDEDAVVGNHEASQLMMPGGVERHYDGSDNGTSESAPFSNNQSHMVAPSSKSATSEKASLKFLIYGRTGLIGGLLGQLCEKKGIVFEYGKGHLVERSSLIADIQNVKPTHVFNAAGVTGRPNVDWCESHKTETIRANVAGTLTLADVCREHGLLMMNFATGCIFEYNASHPLGSGVGFKCWVFLLKDKGYGGRAAEGL